MATDLYFGVDVNAKLHTYVSMLLAPELAAKYEVSDFAVIISHNTRFCPAALFNSDAPEEPDVMFVHRQGDSAKFGAPEGRDVNVMRKLAFVYRTGLDSSEALKNPDLLEPGDLPIAGAGIHRGYVGGVSGFEQEVDWKVFCIIVDRYILLRQNAVLPVLQATLDEVRGGKPSGGHHFLAV